jgi:hypothetical protein
MARKCSREQVSQKVRDRPFSTAVVQVKATSSPGAVAPQNEQVTATTPRVGALGLERAGSACSL